MRFSDDTTQRWPVWAVMRMPDRRRTWLEIMIIAVMAAIVCLLLFSTAKAQDCVDGASDHRLRVEMAERGYDRWGCWTDSRIMSRWVPPPDPDDDDWFEVKIWGVGSLVDIERTYKFVFTDSLETWWPAYMETLWAVVRALDPDGAGAWSDTSEVFVFNRGVPDEDESLSLPALRE